MRPILPASLIRLHLLRACCLLLLPACAVNAERAQLHALAMQVDSSLTAYIELHDEILEKAGTLSSLIENIFVAPVPFDQLHQKSREMEERWQGLCRLIRDFLDRHQGTLTPDERNYGEVLLRYSEAVRDAVSLLRERQAMLYAISQGSDSAGTASWAEFKALDRRYEEAIARYLQIGKDLNPLHSKVFGGNRL